MDAVVVEGIAVRVVEGGNTHSQNFTEGLAYAEGVQPEDIVEEKTLGNPVGIGEHPEEFPMLRSDSHIYFNELTFAPLIQNLFCFWIKTSERSEIFRICVQQRPDIFRKILSL